MKLDNGEELRIPRRELWDVRMQLMAEDENPGNKGSGASVGLGDRDVKTGVYEGGFKSWESSGDLLGCGTALPSLALLQWYLQQPSPQDGGLHLSLADYNPSVLSLVTLPNLLLIWAQTTHPFPFPPDLDPDPPSASPSPSTLSHTTTWPPSGELELTPSVLAHFLTALEQHNITLSFFSGAWGRQFVDLVVQVMGLPGENESENERETGLLILGAETIYSPFALGSFAETVMALLGDGKGNANISKVTDVSLATKQPEKVHNKPSRTALVGAKKVYFGVGGSISDFCELVRREGGVVSEIREETEGVRRVVVEVR
ncbi:hypothetical protein B7494_g8645 [Chlorociboria aeruginascens]|nr:hypothetical protein B7494_g8645 [Chlorociboria aeruginascens]